MHHFNPNPKPTDLWGRGLSDCPKTKHTLALYTDQLAGLLDHLAEATGGLSTSPIHLFGHSMGGAVAAGFTQRFPQRVQRLILNAPAGMAPELPMIGRITGLPVFGELLMAVAPYSTLAEGCRIGFFDPAEPASAAFIAKLEANSHHIVRPGSGFLKPGESVCYFFITIIISNDPNSNGNTLGSASRFCGVCATFR